MSREDHTNRCGQVCVAIRRTESAHSYTLSERQYAFTIADESGAALLVIYKGPERIRVDTGIRVTGTVRKAFELSKAEKFLGVGLPDDSFVSYFGEPYIQATSVETDVEFGQQNAGG